jgi:hypothetical protein
MPTHRPARCTAGESTHLPHMFVAGPGWWPQWGPAAPPISRSMKKAPEPQPSAAAASWLHSMLPPCALPCPWRPMWPCEPRRWSTKSSSRQTQAPCVSKLLRSSCTVRLKSSTCGIWGRGPYG